MWGGVWESTFLASYQELPMRHHPWHGGGLEHSAGWLGSALPPQTSFSPAPHPQENSPYADFQGLWPPLTSPNLDLFHTLQVSSQALGESRPFQRSFYPRVANPAFLSLSTRRTPLPLPQKALLLKVRSTQQQPRSPAAKVAEDAGQGRERR